MSGHTIIPVAIGLVIGISFLTVIAVRFGSVVPIQNIHIPPIPRAHEPMTAIVTIPEGAALPGGNFEPAIIKVIIGTNNTVKWINDDSIMSSVVADNNRDPNFFNITNVEYQTINESDISGKNNFIMPGHFFEYTFTQVGVFSYHSVPHPQMKGTVIVYPQDWQTNGYVPTEPVKYDFQAMESAGNYLKQRVNNYVGITLYSTSPNIPSNRSHYLYASDFFSQGNTLPLRYYPPDSSDSFYSIDTIKHNVTDKCANMNCVPFDSEGAAQIRGKLVYVLDSAWVYKRSNGELAIEPDGFYVDAYTGEVVLTTFHCPAQKQEWCK